MKFNKYTARATVTLLGVALLGIVVSGTFIALLEYLQPTLTQLFVFVGIMIALYVGKGFIETYADILEARDNLKK